MKTQTAIKQAGSCKALATLLNVTPGAVSQWGEELPKARIWQLKLLRPSWFKSRSDIQKLAKPAKRKAAA